MFCIESRSTLNGLEGRNIEGEERTERRRRKGGGGRGSQNLEFNNQICSVENSFESRGERTRIEMISDLYLAHSHN